MDYETFTAAVAAVFTMAGVPDVPEPLQVPAGQRPAFELLANGVQVYECVAAQGGRPGWKLTAPEATLRDRAGTPMGKHYGGPTWEAPDGSSIIGTVRARAPSTDAAAIPLLLLDTRPANGRGMFTAVNAVQRLETHGGQAPAGECTPSDRVRVPYSATYYLYANARQ